MFMLGMELRSSELCMKCRSRECASVIHQVPLTRAATDLHASDKHVSKAWASLDFQYQIGHGCVFQLDLEHECLAVPDNKNVTQSLVKDNLRSDTAV